MEKMEKRTFDIDMRVIQREDGKRTMSGHAAVFNVETNLGFGIREQVAPGAFADSIVEDDVRALFNHDANFVLGRNKAGTLSMREDDKGLFVEIDPPDTQFARDLTVSMERGDITQMSFAFNVVKQSWEEREDHDLRTLEKVKLWDVSPVTYPQYPETDIAVNCRDAWKNNNKPPEDNSWRVTIDSERDKIDLTFKEVF